MSGGLHILKISILHDLQWFGLLLESTQVLTVYFRDVDVILSVTADYLIWTHLSRGPSSCGFRCTICGV